MKFKSGTRESIAAYLFMMPNLPILIFIQRYFVEGVKLTGIKG